MHGFMTAFCIVWMKIGTECSARVLVDYMGVQHIFQRLTNTVFRERVKAKVAVPARLMSLVLFRVQLNLHSHLTSLSHCMM